MMFPDTVNVFKRFVSDFGVKKLDNNIDLCIYPNIYDYRIGLVRTPFQLHIDETVLMIRDTSFFSTGNQGCVVTDWGVNIINDNENLNDIIQFSWQDVEKVEYSGQNVYFFFSETDRNNRTNVPIRFFIKDLSGNKPSWWGNQFAKVFQKMADTQKGDTPEKIKNRLFEHYNAGDYDKAIEEADLLYNSTDDVEFQWTALGFKGMALTRKALSFNWDSDKMSEEECEKQIESRSYYAKLAYDTLCQAEKINQCPEVQYYKGVNKYYGVKNGDWDLARRLFIDAMTETNNKEIKDGSCQYYKEITEAIIESINEFCSKEFINKLENKSDDERKALIESVESHKFTNCIPLQERQFLLFAKNDNQIAGYYDPDDNIQWVFTLDQRPLDIKIEGILEANTLYIAHPMQSDIYLPYETSEDALFMDKVQEFCYLCQCLGAVSITFKSVRGKLVSEESLSTRNFSADGNVRLAKGSANGNINKHNTSDYTSHNEKELTQEFEPTKAPYCPDGLIWLNSDSSWSKLIKQRLEGNILTWSYRISSSETIHLTQNRKVEVKASFENLMKKVNANYDSNRDMTFRKTEETEWELSVKFKDSRLIGTTPADTPTQTPVASKALTDVEIKFLEEVKFCYEDDNHISDEERTFLERKRNKLGLSQERAEEIIAMVEPQLTESELEYIEFFKDMVSQPNNIPPRTRDLLDREAASLGISPDRKEALEKGIQL